MTSTDPIRIANCSGFYGDRVSAAAEMVEGGPIDVLTGDWLAELTMLILARTQAKRPGGGYARTFVTQMEQVMGTCLDRGIKVVSNAGGLDPDGCAEAVAEVADKLGLSPTIAYVQGDDLLPRLGALAEAGVTLTHFETGEPIDDLDGFLTANAYLGAWGIVDALNRGADIVITGRVTDAAVVCGPAAWHHGWARDRLGRAGRGRGGRPRDRVRGPGHRWELLVLHRDQRPATGRLPLGRGGGRRILRHRQARRDRGSGVDRHRHLPAPLRDRRPGLPRADVTSRFDTIELTEVGPDRVRIHGTKGEPPPPP